MTEIFSSAILTPDTVLAGDSVEFKITLTAGPDFTPGPARIILDMPATLGFSRPSLSHQEDHGFMEVYVSNPGVTYLKRNWDMEIDDFPTREKTSWRGMAQRLFVLDLSDGTVPGDTIEIHWGDTGHGYGPGAKVTSVVPRPDYRPVIHVRYFEGTDRGLPDLGRSFKGVQRPEPDCVEELSFEVKPRETETLRLIRMTDRALLLPLDRFWNVPEYERAGEISESDSEAEKNSFSVFEFIDKAVQVKPKTHSLLDCPRMDDIYDGMNIYWGDMHTHSSHSNDCIEREKLQMSPADLFDFARYRAGLDFIASTDHHQPWDRERNKIGEERWNIMIDAVREKNEDGAFLTFPGIEYRSKRGDTAVIFNWIPEYSEVDQPSWTDIRELWKALEGKSYLTIPHFHNGGSLGKDEWWENIESGIEPVLEIMSCHGSYEGVDILEHPRPQAKRFRDDQHFRHYMKKGFRYGAVGNSDGHKGHTGSSGLTAVYAPSLEKDVLLEFYRKRNVYGTTNARIRVLFTGNGELMGSVVPNCDEKIFYIDVQGENILKGIELYRNGELHTRLIPDSLVFSDEIKISDPEPANWYLRVTQRDNHAAVSSPVFFE